MKKEHQTTPQNYVGNEKRIYRHNKVNNYFWIEEQVSSDCYIGTKYQVIINEPVLETNLCRFYKFDLIENWSKIEECYLPVDIRNKINKKITLTTFSFPEHDKFSKFNEFQMSALNEFTKFLGDFCNEKGLDLVSAKENFYQYTTNEILLEFLGIDKYKLEKEKEQMEKLKKGEG